MVPNTKLNSNILLLCLGLDTNKKEAKKANVNDLLNIYGNYGNLKKIMIFSKKNILKGFLEYSTKEEAANAIKETHDIFVGKYGKARVYYSDLQTLTGTKFLEFWENGVNVKRNPFEEVSNKIANYNNVNPKNSIQRSDKKRQFKNVPNSSSRSIKRNTVGHMNKQKTQLFQPSGFKFGSVKRNSDWLSRVPSKNSVLSQNKKRFSDWNSNSSKRNSERIVLKKGSNFKVNEDPDIIEDFMPFKTNMAPSRVVLISNLLTIFENSKEVFNLFSCFGDIVKILLMKNLEKVMVEYTNLEGSKICIANINNLKISGTLLRVNYSKYQHIDLKKNNRSENSVQFNDVLLPKGKSRFSKDEEEENFDSCSEKILISTTKTKLLKPIDVYLFIEKKAKPLSIKLLKNKENKDIINLEVTYDCIQKSITTMIKYHNFTLKDNILKIKFVK